MPNRSPAVAIATAATSPTRVSSHGRAQPAEALWEAISSRRLARRSGTRPRKHRWDRARQDLQVEREGPSIDVVEIECDSVIEVFIGSRLDLPKPADSRLHRKATAMPNVVTVDFPGWCRARADEAHVAFE